MFYAVSHTQFEVKQLPAVGPCCL